MRRHTWSVSALVACVLATASATEGFAQTGVVRGTVVDSASRRPVDAVQVTIVGSMVGAITNASGQYVIRNAPVGNHVVRAARLGHTPAQRQVNIVAGDSVVVDFAMRATAVTLSTVVTVGYGTSERRAVTNSVTTVRAEDIANTPIASIDGALQGKAAGLQVKADSEARSAYGDSGPADVARPDATKAAGEDAKPSGDDEKDLSSG